MSTDIEEFTEKNPTIIYLMTENTSMQFEIEDLKAKIRKNNDQIKFLKENRLNEGV